MADLTPEGQRIVEETARRYSMSTDAVRAILETLVASGGGMAQFNHPDLGGMGQWSSGGMIMIGDMFNSGLKSRIGALCAELSDLIGRKPPLLLGAAGIVVITFPLMLILRSDPRLETLVGVQVAIAIFIALFTGPAPAALAELYPARVRSSGMSLAYNGAVTLFGGFAPFISTWLIAKTGTPLAPAFYVVTAGAISVVALLFMRETANAPAA